MKKLLLLLVLVTFCIASSCSPEDDNLEFTLELVPIQDVADMPHHFERGRTYNLKLFYSMPSDCHYLNNVLPEQQGPNEWMVALEAFVVEDEGCDDYQQMVMEEAIVEFVCTPSYSGDTCTLKFYSGEDEQGNPTFIERTVPVQ